MLCCGVQVFFVSASLMVIHGYVRYDSRIIMDIMYVRSSCPLTMLGAGQLLCDVRDTGTGGESRCSCPLAFYQQRQGGKDAFLF